jgi:hypothetical protein
VARLQTAVLCNAASVEQSGLVSMLGAFIDTLTGTSLPIRQNVWLVSRLLFDPADVGIDQAIDIVVENDASTGPPRPLIRISGTVRAEPTADIDPRILGGGPIVFPLPLEFPQPGLYHVMFSLNGDLLWDAPILVKLADRAA